MLACRRNLPAGNVRGSLGLPIPGTSLCVVDPETLAPTEDGRQGLVLARGPGVMQVRCLHRRACRYWGHRCVLSRRRGSARCLPERPVLDELPPHAHHIAARACLVCGLLDSMKRLHEPTRGQTKDRRAAMFILHTVVACFP